MDPYPSRVERRTVELAAVDAAANRGWGGMLWALVRLSLGFIFLWAFLDKLFGFDRSTPQDRAWVNDGSPTSGFLSGVDGPFADFFNGLAGETWVDWLFMIGLAGLGVALILGIGIWIAAVTGAILLVLMWMASLPIATNPFIDDHLVYALVLLAMAATRVGLGFSLHRWWANTPLVRRLRFLE